MCSLAQIEGATVLFLIALAVTTGLLLFRTQRQLGAKPQPAHRSEWRKPQAAARPAVPLASHSDPRQWEIEMHDLAHELCARIDSKLGILDSLIQDARQQITRLESAIERAERLATSESASSSTRHPPAGRGNRGRLPQAHQAAALAGGLRVDLPALDGPQARIARRYDEIYALADAGHGSDHIAQQLGSPVGEIELILGLRDQRLEAQQ
ncbi:MAG: hypothetical protein WD847_04160 [Pirellulales bacterium]